MYACVHELTSYENQLKGFIFGSVKSHRRGYRTLCIHMYIVHVHVHVHVCTVYTQQYIHVHVHNVHVRVRCMHMKAMGL